MEKRQYVLQYKSWTRINMFFGIILIYALIYYVLQLSWYVMMTQNHKLEIPAEGKGLTSEEENLWIRATQEKMKKEAAENLKMKSKAQEDTTKKKSKRMKSNKKRRAFTGGKIKE